MSGRTRMKRKRNNEGEEHKSKHSRNEENIETGESAREDIMNTDEDREREEKAIDDTRYNRVKLYSAVTGVTQYTWPMDKNNQGPWGVPIHKDVRDVLKVDEWWKRENENEQWEKVPKGSEPSAILHKKNVFTAKNGNGISMKWMYPKATVLVGNEIRGKYDEQEEDQGLRRACKVSGLKSISGW